MRLPVCGATGHMSLVFLGGKNEFDTFVETEINGALSTSFTVQFSESCWRSKELIIATNTTLLCYLIYYN